MKSNEMNEDSYFKLCYNLNPCVIHGTVIKNMPSIFKNGLLSGRSLSTQGIEAERQESYVQHRNRKEHMLSCWRIGWEKEVWNTKEERAVVLGRLTDEERHQQIKSLAEPLRLVPHSAHWLASWSLLIMDKPILTWVLCWA